MWHLILQPKKRSQRIELIKSTKGNQHQTCLPTWTSPLKTTLTTPGKKGTEIRCNFTALISLVLTTTLKMLSFGLQVQTVQLGEKMFQQSGETEIFLRRPPPSWYSCIRHFGEDRVLLQLEKGLNIPQRLLQVFSRTSASFSLSRSGRDAIVLK